MPDSALMASVGKRPCRLRLQFLGHFAVTSDDRIVVAMPPAARSLFAFLAFHSGRRFRREALVEQFWQHTTPHQGRSCLGSALCRIRTALSQGGVAADALIADRETIALRTDVVAWSDLGEIKAVDSGATVPDAQVLRSLMGLFRGRLLEDQSAEWILPQRRRLEEVRKRCLIGLVGYCRAAGDYDACVDLLEQHLAHDPLDEKCHRELIATHREEGAIALSVEAFERCRRVLQEELGVSPSPATMALLNGPERQREHEHERHSVAPAKIDLRSVLTELDEISARIRALQEQVIAALDES